MSETKPFSLNSNKPKNLTIQPLVEPKFTHALCIGQTGSGKTTGYIYPNLQNRMKLKHGILFFDIKGNEHQAIKYFAKQENRLDDVVEIGKPWGKNINILENLKESEFISLIENIINKPQDGGNNSYFYASAVSLAQTIYKIYSRVCIINQELEELNFEYRYNFFEHKSFTLFDIYMAVKTIDDIYDFFQCISYAIYTLEEDGFTKFIYNNQEFFSSSLNKDTEKSQKAKNILLNISKLRRYLSDLDTYNVEKEDRSDRSKFDPSLISVLNTLSGPMEGIIHTVGDAINQRDDPFKISQALNEGKIIIINVRVIPDKILRTILSKLYENFLDRNLFEDKHKNPISIFIDEAQRLIDKDLPLDVLRSSKVDVLMAVQSEAQLLSKFERYEDWKQLAVNIHKKLTFYSSLTHENDLSNFHVAPNVLKVFEYLYENENTINTATPIFLEEQLMKETEVNYQVNILNLKGLKKSEYYSFNPKHFERENELLIKNSKNSKIKFKKWFSNDDKEQLQNELDLIDMFIKNEEHNQIMHISPSTIKSDDFDEEFDLFGDMFGGKES